MNDYSDPPSEEYQKAALIDLAVKANEDLEAAATTSANRAFNMGCLVGILPACAIVLLTLSMTRFSWVGGLVMTILMSLGMVLLANVIASIARNNTASRLFLSTIQPQIEDQLRELNSSEEQFASICRDNLYPDSLLIRFYPETALQEMESENPTQESE